MAKPDIAQPEERTRQTEALRLRLAGASYDVIADRLGYAHRASAYNAVAALLKRQESEAAAEYRQIEDARLDALLLSYWPAALRGDLKAAEFVGKLHDRRVKLHGLAAPTKVQVQAEGVTQLELTTRVQEDMRALGFDRVFDVPPESDDPAESWANT